MSSADIFPFREQEVLFAPDLPSGVNALLQQAVAVRHNDPAEAERLLLYAVGRYPQCLPVYFALYKFYANGRHLGLAEIAARRALNEAARQGLFSCRLTQRDGSTGPHPYQAGSAGQFYLFTLKALAFIKLRQGEAEQAVDVLALLATLDPEDRSGASVIRQLAMAVEEGDG
jgi:hypothetical protein